MFESMNRAIANRRALEVLAAANPTAAQRGETSCCRSGVCCWRRPPHLTHADLAHLAAYHGLSEGAFFAAYCTVEPGTSDLYCLLLRRAGQPGGGMLSALETYDIATPCVFLDVPGGNACGIHDGPAKPAACVEYRCWEPEANTDLWVGIWTRERLRELGWNGYEPFG